MKDPLGSLPGYLLRRASAASLSQLNQRLAALNLNHTDASLLLVIGDNPGITQSQAGRMLGIQRANMVPLLTRLEARGWICRQQADGRSQGLSLSISGDHVKQSTQQVVDAYESGLLDKVPEDLRRFVVPILRSLWIEMT